MNSIGHRFRVLYYMYALAAFLFGCEFTLCMQSRSQNDHLQIAIALPQLKCQVFGLPCKLWHSLAGQTPGVRVWPARLTMAMGPGTHHTCLLTAFVDPSIHHNEIRDITADLLSEVCHSVGTEPCLQEITEEQLTHTTANREDGARLDIVAESFWGRDQQCTFFDVRVLRKATAILPWLSVSYVQTE